MLNAAPPDLKTLEVAVVARGQPAVPPWPARPARGIGRLPIAAQPRTTASWRPQEQGARLLRPGRRAGLNDSKDLTSKAAKRCSTRPPPCEQTCDLLKSREEIAKDQRQQHDRNAAPAATKGRA